MPVAISMLVTFVTAVGMLGTPAEMYAFGTQVSTNVNSCLIYLYTPGIQLSLLTVFFLENPYQKHVPLLVGV